VPVRATEIQEYENTPSECLGFVPLVYDSRQLVLSDNYRSVKVVRLIDIISRFNVALFASNGIILVLATLLFISFSHRSLASFLSS